MSPEGEISVSRVERIDYDKPVMKTKTAPPPTVVNAVPTPTMGGGAPPAGRNIDRESGAYIERMKRQWAEEEAAADS
uniref:Uncharacterized protein n=1 Tax=Oryza brachyantha TaxID=4533 RepID=J3M3W1_ORYBR